MTTTVPAADVASSLRRLYFVRFAFAVVWAALVFATGSSLGVAGVALLVLYPVFDVVAAVVDVRSSKAAQSVSVLYVNIAISLLAAIGLAVVGSSGIAGVLRVWGSWAVVAGVVQLVVGLRRRGLGGQWPMILSGGISVLAGGSFILQATKDGASLTNLAGYATLGGIFFLVSALRLGRARRNALVA
ncbi:hypothetical protein [Amycolatopsis sp. NBC_01286]|uniref:hypothetical protein n=1 Tax=Amycolatopsis sp. NBC_01286 TaxID=2903560 RepID=UPI002E136BA7|nr:hypothetical protein OG570_39745 [Amycolatopsis sp. NBC_01286]